MLQRTVRSMNAARGVEKLGRRGQTLVMAIAVLFLTTLLGTVWITLLVRNIARTARHAATDDALAQALAGIRFASRQFKESAEGADWRPRQTEPLYLRPSMAAPPAQRALDPDYPLLSDSGTYRRCFVRFPNGRGYFMLRVRYEPSFVASGAAAAGANTVDEFNKNSAMIHIESIGVAREFDPNDPTFLNDPTETGAAAAQTVPYRKVEAYVPIGMLDQLLWITNVTDERGPAELGVPPYRDGTGQLVQYGSLWEGGGIRSEMSIQWHGRNTVRLYPARWEGVNVAGDLLLSPQANDTGVNPQLTLQLMDDSGDAAGTVVIGGNNFPVYPKDDQDDNPLNDSLIAAVNADQESASGGFNSFPVYSQGRVEQNVLRDDRQSSNPRIQMARNTRRVAPPNLTQVNPSTGLVRWVEITRDSGGVLQIDDNGQTRYVNAGWYGLTDALPPAGVSASDWERVRARGLYLDNIGDIQYPNDRRAVKDEWLQRGGADVRRRGWLAGTYVPSVQDGGTLHPLAEVVFANLPAPGGGIRPVILVTRYDIDTRQMNLYPATGRQRLFYDLATLTASARGGQATLRPVGQTRVFDYPANGVFFCAGSVRVRGTIGAPGSPRQLHLVSAGSIYIEGSVIKGDRGSALALSAFDYVTLNPTAFTRLQPGTDTVVEADTFGTDGQPVGYHFNIQQGATLDFSVNAAAPLGPSYLHFKHSGGYEDETSVTEFTLFQPGGGRYDFGSNVPPTPPPPPPAPYPNNPYAVGPQFFYLFRSFATNDYRDPSAQDPVRWGESSFRTQPGNPANFERKSFFLPTVGNIPGVDTGFRILVGENLRPSAQPYWLANVAVIPQNEPLPIRVEAAIFAYTGSWFVIPPPFFNDNTRIDPSTNQVWDSRANFAATGLRAPGTFPRNTADYPFYHEPLNVDVTIVGSITENVPAPSEEQALWTERLWSLTSGWDPSQFPIPARPAYSPRISYRYDADYRRLVRVRYTRTGQELVAWALPGLPTLPAPPAGIPLLDVAIANGLAQDSYVEVLPLIPRIPASSLLYEGNPF